MIQNRSSSSKKIEAIQKVYHYIISNSNSKKHKASQGIPQEILDLIKNEIPKNALVEYKTSSLLMTAVCQGNKAIVDELLKNRQDVNYQLALNGQTALMRAVQVGNKKMVEYLLDKGADPTIQSGDGRYALQFFNIRLGDHSYRDVMAKRMVVDINRGTLEQKVKQKYILALKAYIMAAGSKYFTIPEDKNTKPIQPSSDPYLNILKHYYGISSLREVTDSRKRRISSAPVNGKEIMMKPRQAFSLQDANRMIPRPLPALPPPREEKTFEAPKKRAAARPSAAIKRRTPRPSTAQAMRVSGGSKDETSQ